MFGKNRKGFLRSQGRGGSPGLPHSIPSEVLAGPASPLLAEEMLLSHSEGKIGTMCIYQGSCHSRFASVHAQCSQEGRDCLLGT